MDKLKYNLKVTSILLKESVLIIVYSLLEGLISLMILMINSVAAKVFLLILNVAFFAFMCIIFSKSLGEKQYKAKMTADIRRGKGNAEDIIKYCRPENEYRFINGILLGLFSSIFLYILLIIRLFLKTKTGIDAAIKLLYFIYGSFLTLTDNPLSVYYLLLFSLITVAACAFGYFMGAKKIMLQQVKLQKTHEEIYGKGSKN